MNNEEKDGQVATAEVEANEPEPEQQEQEEQEIDAETLQLARQLKDEIAAKLKAVLDNLGKYPHAIKDSLRYDASARKFQVRITCVECGDTNRWVYTSDLFQVSTCKVCADKAKAAKRASKQARINAALEMIKAGTV